MEVHKQQQEVAEVVELRRFTVRSREQRSRTETDEAGGDSFVPLIEAETRPCGLWWEARGAGRSRPDPAAGTAGTGRTHTAAPVAGGHGSRGDLLLLLYLARERERI